MKKEMKKRAGIAASAAGIILLCIAAYSCASGPKNKAGDDTTAAAPAAAATEAAGTAATSPDAAPAAESADASAHATPAPAATSSTAADATAAPVPATSTPAAAQSASAAKAPEDAEAKKAQTSSNTAIATPTQEYVLDWANRGLGEPYNPDWLKHIVEGNTQDIRKMYELGDSSRDIVRYTVGTARATSSGAYIGGMNNAMTVADNNYAVELANELKRIVLSQTGAFLNGTEFQALNNAVGAAKVTLVGQRRLMDFWQLVETRNSMTGERTRQYIYYIVYTTSKVNWDAMIDMYLKQVLGYLPKDRLAEVAAATKAASTQETAKTQDDVLNQLQGQVDALKSDLSNNAQQQAYASGNPSAAAAASVTPDDYDWINAMIQSTQLLFQ